ncbi:hybrid sensor histidine kinase/response regulator, partial [Pseudodesulfovibrio pelocollis]|uniref:hybrid sensor histidine kinase/response regulator n=1 Tax=Pseudodesulfovibrio pelocollis TaxID=3051432 RepID=UPI00255B1945
VVVFDFNLPGMNGLEAGEALLSHKLDLPLVLLTGVGSELIAVKAMRLGFFDYMVKDVSAGYLKLLPAKLEEVLRRCKREREHRETQERYARLVEQSPDIFYTVSSTRGWLFASKRLEEILGYSAQTIMEIPDIWMSKIHSQDQALLRDAMIGTSAGRHFCLEYRIQAKDGQWKWLRDRSISANTTGDETIISGIATDITEEKNLEYLKENFEMITHHDLRSPLSGIIGISRIMEQENEGSARELACAITDAATRMLDMLNRWMDLYKLEAGIFESTPTNVDIDKLLQSVMSTLLHSPAFQGANIRFTSCSTSIMTDKVLLSTIVTNLLKNALEAGGADDLVHLDCQDDGDKLTIEVRNAQEVPPDIKPYFFEKFYSRGKRSGTGLGNFSAKLMTDALGGHISMTSSAEKGTLVRIKLNK